MLSDYPIAPALPASDMGRARKFYETKLGLKPDEDGSDENGLSFRCGDGTGFFLYPSAFAGTNQATAAAWAVPDLNSVVDELKAKGVEFQEYDMPDLTTINGVAELPDGSKVAWFTDTEGNILAINQLVG